MSSRTLSSSRTRSRRTCSRRMDQARRTRRDCLVRVTPADVSVMLALRSMARWAAFSSLIRSQSRMGLTLGRGLGASDGGPSGTGT